MLYIILFPLFMLLIKSPFKVFTAELQMIYRRQSITIVVVLCTPSYQN